MKDKTIPLPSPAIDAFLNCIESKLKITLVVTSTSEAHDDEDPHTHGMAVDVRKTGHYKDFECAAKGCGAVWVQNEKDHYRSQLTKKGTFRKK